MKVKSSYLNFYKMILEKVKFDHQLFWKEYQKATQMLTESERSELNQWVNKQFQN
ncbi:MAG: hypothetical protein HUJ25_02980 [Crocinitomicaceae bacterium]|nr:hypothetical protein [Crocinitomicaceae bacterium]